MTPRPDFQAHEACEPTHYTVRELLVCRRELRDILIAPFSESKCKGIGYNISPSELCYSVKKKYLLQVHRTDQATYVLIPPHDTVLTLSYEYLQVSSGVAGCFLSRLRPVTQGLGNISTTLDPCWKGMLLLAINNPSSKKVKRLNDAVNNSVGLCPLNRINDVPAGLLTQNGRMDRSLAGLSMAWCPWKWSSQNSSPNACAQSMVKPLACPALKSNRYLSRLVL